MALRAHQKRTLLLMQKFAPRTPWRHFPPVLIHAEELNVKKHPAYAAAKAGDAERAQILVEETISTGAIDELIKLTEQMQPILVSAHAFEQTGVNAIPEVLADEIAHRTGFAVEQQIVQTNVVGHTGAKGDARLARQAHFAGPVEAGRRYILVDDFIGQGGTLANLRGHIETLGGQVVAATVLTGKPFSAILELTSNRLDSLRRKHGHVLENWWLEHFGHAFDCLTESEARYIERIEDADSVRDRITAAK